MRGLRIELSSLEQERRAKGERREVPARQRGAWHDAEALSQKALTTI